LITNTDFDAIRISISSPELIREWSYGEIVQPETINYRTQKPERGGLFCQKIFGPVKDWECACGKYKGVRYKGIVCDKCGVEVTRAMVRRERMGHIELAAPVVHVWFTRGTPNYLALLVNVTPRKLERVLYYAQYMVTEVDEEARTKALAEIDQQLSATQEEVLQEFSAQQEVIEQEYKDNIANLEKLYTGKLAEETDAKARKALEKKWESDKELLEKSFSQKSKKLRKEVDKEEKERAKLLSTKRARLEGLTLMLTLTERQYDELAEEFGQVFTAKMGAEAVLDVLAHVDLPKLEEELRKEIKQTASKQKRKKSIKRLRVAEALVLSGNDPSWMILQALPVIPPDLRPMVQLDGGRFAASDLNDLYRRVINRNNRLKRLKELNALEVIMRNEKRMLQEAVDALVDNSAHGEKVISRRNRKLKSLSDILKGKQGRFRQNLLGKRVDYSGRSVIVVGPNLRLHQCGLPKKMAVELFRPFILRELLARDFVHTIKAANRMIERMQPEVWDVLDDIIKGYPVLLNRAPTLHRLGIQAFYPVLVEGDAIQLHPLVCMAFNADFDGDQMAVHVPLSEMAKAEARELMLSSHNLLLPADGKAAVGPTRDMLLGSYYMTYIIPGTQGEGKVFSSPDDAKLAYEMRKVALNAEIEVRFNVGQAPVKTSVGRIIFNQIVPPEFGFLNQVMNKKALGILIERTFEEIGMEETAKLVDDIKDTGFKFSTLSGATFAVDDVHIPPEKDALLAKADDVAANIQQQYEDGLISFDESYEHSVDLWMKTTDVITQAMMKGMDPYSSLSMMIDSGARGNIEQMRQMAGMRGLMADPSGRIIDLPIKSNFKEGLTVLEYFISTHGARKGRADTALRTADSGYLTRRMVDVAQNVIVYEEDCGTPDALEISVSKDDADASEHFLERSIGRMAGDSVVDPKSGEVLVAKNEEITEEIAATILASEIKTISIRSVLFCRSHFGVCQRCYGRDMARGIIVQMGEPVGIVAAQAIGEPGTQLTMRTFHAGGVAGGLDITQGLPRVEELFEARTPKGEAPIAEIDGIVSITEENNVRHIVITALDFEQESHPIEAGMEVLVENKSQVKAKDAILKVGRRKIAAGIDGMIKLTKDKVLIVADSKQSLEYTVPRNTRLHIEDGQLVARGQLMIEGSINLKQLLEVSGVETTQRYLVEEVQKIYRSQGVGTNDKHIEIIVRRMLARVKITESGDSEFLPGDLINRFKFDYVKDKLVSQGKVPPEARAVILGITKAALNSGSFLSAASFQETIRVLTKAAVYGLEDRLVGLKENLIIGKLIPAGPYARQDLAIKAASL